MCQHVDTVELNLSMHLSMAVVMATIAKAQRCSLCMQQDIQNPSVAYKNNPCSGRVHWLVFLLQKALRPL